MRITAAGNARLPGSGLTFSLTTLYSESRALPRQTPRHLADGLTASDPAAYDL